MKKNNINWKDNLRKEAWNYAFYTFGTGWIFEQRALSLRQRLRLLKFLGIFVPVLIGGITLSFGIEFEYIGIFIFIASAFGILQLIISIWALISKWDDSFAYATESFTSNQQISDSFKDLAVNLPKDFKTAEAKFELVNIERKAREAQDNKQGITEAEKRAGMRAALRQFRRKCAGCDKIPMSLDPSDCPICGKFKINIFKKIKEAK